MLASTFGELWDHICTIAHNTGAPTFPMITRITCLIMAFILYIQYIDVYFLPKTDRIYYMR
uniref:Uncharacterized protein n=1 Tax=Arundo donax TaxID=35708 RepID=A0A0A9GPI6_ARUDO